MADALQTLWSFPPTKKPLSPKEYESEVNAFLSKLEQLPPSIWLQTNDHANILESLDPAVHSIPYVLALSKQIRSAGEDQKKLELLLNLATIFIVSFDSIQVRYVGQYWRDVFEFVCGLYMTLHTTDLQPLVIALLRLDPTAGTFTSSHLDVLRTCLAAGVPSQALPILDRDIYAFPQNATKNVPTEFSSEQSDMSNTYLTPKSGLTSEASAERVLEYYLLGAHVYISQHNLDRARLFLEYVLLSPSINHSTSALQVEAYQKWLLVGMLQQGKAFALPRTADMAVVRDIRLCSKPYDTLAEAFEKRDRRKLAATADAGAEIWGKDGNAGLVRLSVDVAVTRYHILDMQKTYAALTVPRVAEYIDMPVHDAMYILKDMISRGELDARIDSQDGESVLRIHHSKTPKTSLSFAPTPTNATHSETDLEAQAARIASLVAAIRDADRRLQLTKEYVDIQKRSKRSAGTHGDPADAMDVTWDAPIAHDPIDDGDEDIMAS